MSESSHETITQVILRNCSVDISDLEPKQYQNLMLKIGRMHGAAYVWQKPNEIENQLEKTRAKLADAMKTDEGLIVEGLRRNVINKMGLRDQPILDQYQDEIFRLPLDSQLLILGAPGTGKTTTLIRRLGQKLDIDFLDENEKRLVRADNPTGRQRHSESWIMFTPTELLKLYVKEAFAKEGVAAPDDRISTWTTFRDNLGPVPL